MFTMMTQDRANHPLATPTSPRNLNPSAPAFRQGQAAPTSPKNLNPSAPAFRQSPAGEKSPTDGAYTGAESRAPGLLTNGDVHANGSNYMVPQAGSGASVPRGAGVQSLGPLQGQGPQSTVSMGLALTPSPLMAVSTQSNQQPVVATVIPQQQQQPVYVGALQDNVGGQQVRSSNQNSPVSGIAECDNPPNGAVSVGVVIGEEAFEAPGDNEELESAIGGQEYKYPDEVLAPIRKQMQFYFSNENLPNDKFLNQHMDSDKFIPLELFLDFGRIKPICNNVDQLMQAVESSSILELSEDKKRVRVSQCRKTLTLRGFPATATEEDVRQFILEMGASVPTHIEFVMYKEKYSVWYVSFKDENAALNSFFQFHNQKAVYKDHNIGCCIKSSGTLAAAGYFPSTEESNQRRLAHQNQAAVAAPVHAVQSAMPQPQPQQAQALMQPFGTMQLHHSYMPGSPTGFYYQQAPQGAYMPYMAGMIQGWPGPTAAMEPGLIMQNNGLQPQHIRTSMPRPHLMPSGAGAQHRFNRPQRTRQNLERSASERPSDRPPVVSVGSSRSSPRSADGSTNPAGIPQGAYVPRRPTGREDISPQVMSQQQAVPHQFVTPMVTQQHQQHIPSSGAPSNMVNPVTLEPMTHYQQAHHHHHHQQPPVVVHTAITSTTTAHPPPAPQVTNSPHHNTQQHMHHHHSHQPPPQIHAQQQQQQQQHHHHHQQLPQTPHHQQQPQTHHPTQHSSQLQQPPQPHHQQQHQQPNQALQHHHPHQQNMMAPHHHHHPHPQQPHHHPMPPQQVHHQQHHQQPLLGNRPERRGRRKREDNVRNQRSERNQSNRANFGTQAPTAADNFTMEANSFPPLPGALSSITSSEISHENRMSDIVRGISRMSGLGNSGVTRASSSTPSPVATPALITSGASHGLSGSAILDSRSLDDGDSALDDDTSSSQEEVDTDANSLESRSVRSEPQSFAAEPTALPAQPRFQKACTPVSSPALVSVQRQAESRPGPMPVQAPSRGPQQTAHLHQQQQYQVSPTTVSAATLASDAPKLSYAQILALKNREAANIAGACESNLSGALSPSPISGTPNGSNSAHNTASSANVRTSNQSTNSFREHTNYQGGPQQHGSRSSQRGVSKDLTRSDGAPSSRPPNGSRKNSKESRTSNSFDRRKPDTRQK